MKLLWIINGILPRIANHMNIKNGTIGGGWLEGISDSLLKSDGIEIVVCFPYKNSSVSGSIGNLTYYSFLENRTSKYNFKLEDRFMSILVKEKPDVVHVFGTEYTHSYGAIKVAESIGIINKTVVSIQGLVSVYSKHYFAGLPLKIIKKRTLRDFVKNESIFSRRKEFIKKGEYEIRAIKKVKNIIGRTEWDKACSYGINPAITYYSCNETLRTDFYSGRWDYTKCEKYSIFIGSFAYPIKGFHKILEVTPEILKRYPKAKIYIAGENPLKQKLYHQTSYNSYIVNLIHSLRLDDVVIFVGKLSSAQMKERFLSCNVFVLPSSIENSPNTLGEAMLLGVPCIASDVGGVSSMVNHKEDAYLYPFDEPYMIPYYLGKIFDDPENAQRLSNNARKKASITHSSSINRDSLIDIYREIGKRAKGEE